MGADEIAQAARRRNAVAKRTLAVRRAQQRRFRIGLACAAVLHAALFVGVGRWASPRQLGEPDASPEGISVDLVDAADLMSRNSMSDPPDNPPIKTGSVAAPPQPPQPPQPQQEPPPPAEAEPPPPPVPAPAPTRTPAPKKSAALDKALDLPYPADQPQAHKQSPKQPPNKSPSEQPYHDPLDLSLPDISSAPPGRSTPYSRPPGITRSGENYEFGRGVIMALRRTMPGFTVVGQVTIRLFLSEIGNIVEVRLVRSSGDPILDQSVLFSAKQASFPIPPAGATVADRTFMVTYVYRTW